MHNITDNIFHVVPDGDLKEHSFPNSDYCHCKPRVEIQENGNKLVIHNSYDGREFYETADALHADSLRHAE